MEEQRSLRASAFYWEFPSLGQESKATGRRSGPSKGTAQHPHFLRLELEISFPICAHKATLRIKSQ